MGGLSMPTVPGSGQQGSDEYNWLQQQLGLGQQYSRFNDQNPFGSTTWDGNTRTQQYDPRIMEDFYGIMGQRAQDRGVYGGAANEAQMRANRGMDAYMQDIPGMQDSISVGDTQTGFDRGDFIGLPGSENDFADYGQRAEDAMFDKFASRADRRFGQRRDQTETNLRNKGFVAGSDAYGTQMQDLNEAENDAYGQAASDAVLMGGQEQTRRLSDLLRIRGTQEGESQSDLQNFNQGMGQNFAQRMGAGQFQNQARGQRFGEEQTKYMAPFQVMQATRGNQSPILPGMGQGMSNLQQPRTNTWQDFNQMGYGADMNQRNANMNLLETGLGIASRVPWGQVASGIGNWWNGLGGGADPSSWVNGNDLPLGGDTSWVNGSDLPWG